MRETQFVLSRGFQRGDRVGGLLAAEQIQCLHRRSVGILLIVVFGWGIWKLTRS